jgi:hypothetical protein
MQAQQVLHDVLQLCAPKMHRKRRMALEVNVMAALRGRHLTVTDLGRSIRSDAKEKHCIKRADRLLSNHHLHAERRSVYTRVCQSLVGSMSRAIILVDWSDMDGHQRHFLLRASLSMPGRSMTLYEEVHGIDTKDTPGAHLLFLGRLHAMLPLRCRPIIVADAGFRVPWFKQVEALGWDWVCRIRNNNWVELNGDGWWYSCTALHERASRTPKALGEALMTWDNAWPCRLVLYKAKPKGRHQLNSRGQLATTSRSERSRKSASEPWLLATSLPLSSTLAKRVVRLYQQRMQIEEAFRDLKCVRFGLGLDHHICKHVQRLAILLLVAMLALFIAWLMGKALELTERHRDYQANTVRHRTVLSTIFLGLRIIDDHRNVLSEEDIGAAFRHLQQQIIGFHTHA